ncbi:MAG: hypothetical protein OMM_13283, partial [Candidatus Magnetoglobus multicellularis str. Araruama]
NAYILDTNLTIAGDLTLNADNSAIVNATVSNAADSQASALYGAGGSATSGILSSNMVSSNAKAYIDFTAEKGSIAIIGKTDISAQDNASIFANAKVVSSSVTTNDGGASLVDEQISKRLDPDMFKKLSAPFAAEDEADELIDENLGDAFQIDFLSSDGSQVLQFGDRVRLVADHSAGGDANSTFTYMGNGETVDLTHTDYTNLDFWKEDLATQLVPQGLNISDSDSRAIGGMVVRNDVRSTVESFVDNVTFITDAIEISAYENATIVALNDGTVISSGGSAYGSGESLAINGIIATNLVLSSSNAYITNSDMTTSTGDLSIDAKNTSIVDATTKSVTTTGDTAVGVTLAFNTIGWEAQNILFQTVDAIIGTDIGDEKPSEVKAYIEDTKLNIAGNLSLNAESTATLTSSVSNDATSAASALVNASGMAVSGIISSNMVSSLAQAYINFTD